MTITTAYTKNPTGPDAASAVSDAVGAVADAGASVATGVYNRAATLVTYEYDSFVRQSSNPLQSFWDFVSLTTAIEQLSAFETIVLDDARLYRNGPYCGREAECFKGSDAFGGDAAATTTGHTIRFRTHGRVEPGLEVHEIQHVLDIESVGGTAFYESYGAEWLVRFVTPIPGGYHELYWERRGKHVQDNYPDVTPRGRLGEWSSSVWEWVTNHLTLSSEQIMESSFALGVNIGGMQQMAGRS